jgi:hypothetical protein
MQSVTNSVGAQFSLKDRPAPLFRTSTLFPKSTQKLCAVDTPQSNQQLGLPKPHRNRTETTKFPYSFTQFLRDSR